MMHGLEPWIPFLLIAAIVLMAGFVQSAIGFGYGITALAMLPLVIDARSAHILISASGVPVLTMAAWAWRGETDWQLLRLALLGAIVFMPFGLWLFEAMSLDLLVRATGAAIIVMAIQSLRSPSRPDPTTQDPTIEGELISKKSSFAAGAVSGFLAGAVSIAGPPIAAFAMKQPWSPGKFKAFTVQCLLPIAVFRCFGLIATGFVTQSVFLQAAWAVPFAIVGVCLGAAATRQIHADRFRVVVGTSLVLVACLLVFRGSPEATGGIAGDMTSGMASCIHPEEGSEL